MEKKAALQTDRRHAAQEAKPVRMRKSRDDRPEIFSKSNRRYSKY
ncbi:hypothetical protein AB8806_23195 [Ralstonia syzygii subsp. celebesensis]